MSRDLAHHLDNAMLDKRRAETDAAHARHEADRLRRCIKRAPHHPRCSTLRPNPGGCTCWKAEAIGRREATD